jgi:hypothetical protein
MNQKRLEFSVINSLSALTFFESPLEKTLRFKRAL